MNYFIIYETVEEYLNIYKRVIFRLMCKLNFAYKTIDIKTWDNNTLTNISKIHGNKIYILSKEVPFNNKLEIVRLIRSKNDWISPIIILTNKESIKIDYTYLTLILSIIQKKDKLEYELTKNIRIALQINDIKKKTIKFIYKGESYQVPYDDILYIEKNINTNTSKIITKDHEYPINKSIVKIKEELEDTIYFYKTHQSCIVNINNIKKVNYDESIIYFEKCKTSLLSRKQKQKLKELMSEITN